MEKAKIMKVQGISMLPSILPNDKLTIKKSGIIQKGTLIVFYKKGSLVVHRIKKITSQHILTQGDNTGKPEEVNIQHIIGIATYNKTQKRKIKPITMLLHYYRIINFILKRLIPNSKNLYKLEGIKKQKILFMIYRLMT